MKTLTIVDTFGFFFRSFYALPQLNSPDGFPTGLLTGFLNLIAEIEKNYKTDYFLFALDSKGKTFRHDIDANYKANRPKPPEELLKQLPVAIEWIKKMGFASYECEGYEADDIIASCVKLAKNEDIKIRIVTHDKDLYQLIEDEKVSIFSPAKKVDIDAKGCVDKFGIPPEQVRDFLALVGDKADNIPGVKGIGDKGAKKLLDEFKTIENIYENIDKISNARSQKLLNEGKESAVLSKKLTSLYYDLDVFKNLQEFNYPPQNPLLNIVDELQKYQFTRILSRLNKNFVASNEKPPTQNMPQKKAKFEHILLDCDEKLLSLVDTLDEDMIVAFDTETDSLDVKHAKIVGFSFCMDEQKAYYVPIGHNYLGVSSQVGIDASKKALQKIFSCKLVGQNIKFDYHIIKNNFNITPPIAYADTMVLGWLLESTSKVGLDAMAKRFFNYSMKPFKQMVGRGQNFSNVDINDACFYAAEDAWMTYKLFFKLQNLLESSLLDEAKEVENPFLNVIFDMEQVGIKIDQEYLNTLLIDANKDLANLTNNIYKLANTEFNINSVPQLRDVLFNRLQLKPTKKTKTGYSTDESVLNALINDHEIIAKLLDYRELFKLKSTYFEPLLKLSQKDENSRIYTSFLQTGTATGRLASNEPNLQNIPVRTDIGRKTRDAFIAKDGYKLVSLDYSQIELRLLAHFSKDPDMIKAFSEDKDIHLETAIKIFGEGEAKAKRNIAKSINFGLIYGMGSRKLSQTLGISSSDAKSYIESYFASFKTIKEFLSSARENAKKEGFAQTLLKRKRYFNYEGASPMIAASFDRESVNTIFQGSAADLIKLAMLQLDSHHTSSFDARLLLQIHDELIFEVVSHKAEDFAKYAKDIMENIYPLNVPLKTSVSIGDNWGELK